ncbi:unnamed protein product [Anisakis simplex]|uniref:RusA family crossover junction endodeoxyribonuclease n=1 Tax=Anisakis simplex TaxID=6269 RepID=A0A0M3JHI1_ANISI|nr:unnamed protein product [Anisakis simplex]
MIVVVGFVVLGGDVRQRASIGEYSSDYGYYYERSDGFVKRERVLKIWASSSLRERRDGFIDVVSAVVQAEMPVSRGGNRFLQIQIPFRRPSMRDDHGRAPEGNLNLKKWLNIPPEADVESWRRNCTIDTCVDLLACSVDDQKLGVWTEPLTAVFDEVSYRLGLMKFLLR